MIRRYYLLLSIVCLVSAGVCAFGQEKDPNASEVLHNYNESLSWLQSVSMRIEIEIDVDANHPNKWFCPYERHFIFRQDNGRTEWLGQQLIFDDDGDVNPLNSQVINEVITGELYANVLSTPLNAPPRGVWIIRDYKENLEELLDYPGHGSALFGRIFGNSHKSVAELLGESANLHLRDGRENINGVSCYVFEGTTKYGKVTAWIAPEKGYNALKWEIYKTNGDLFDEKPLSSNFWLAVFGSVEVQQVNGVFVTTGGCLTHTLNFTDGRKHIFYNKYKVSDIQLNPDFDALGAFKIDLPDGTRVFMEESPGIRYVWRNGKAVPDVDEPTFEEIDKMVEELKKEK